MGEPFPGIPFLVIREALSNLVARAAAALQESGAIPAVPLPQPEILDPKQPEHGDFSTNLAMVSAKTVGKNPREFGEMLAEKLRAFPEFTEVEVAGPGFINLRIDPDLLTRALASVQERDFVWFPAPSSGGQRINVEFVSVNPNGPITIGSGRGAAYGSTLCNVLQAAGHSVHREYYINDGVNSEQMRLFAESVREITFGRPVPEKGYKGDYVQEVAAKIGPSDHGVDWYQQQSQALMIEAQRTALAEFGVKFDTWFSEQSLHDSGEVEKSLHALLSSQVADNEPVRTKLKLGKGSKIEEVEREPQTQASEDDAEGEGETVWLRSTKFADDMDRVLRRRDGRLTYIASDVSYHRDKFNRPENADRLITILGPDHHGYIGRLTAVVGAMLLADGQVARPEASSGPLHEIDAQLYRDEKERDACQAALALARQRLHVQIYQLVRFLKDGKPAPMRKRDGNIYALIDLMREIGAKVKPSGSQSDQLEAGKDVARFFYLMRSHDTTFDFDLDLAEKQSDENPVFYVQYAHARICSVLEKAREAGFVPSAETDLSVLRDPKELTLIKKILDLPNEVARAAEDYGVHRLATYAIELARCYHSFYDTCRVIQPDAPELSRARVRLCDATRIGLVSTFNLLGISAPARMDRAE